MSRFVAVAPLLLPSLMLAAACSGGGSNPTQPAGGDVVEIRLTSSLRFSPADVTIDPGTTVRWVSDVAMPHTVTPGNATQPGVWLRAESSSAGQVLTHTFNAANQTYAYHCEPHLAAGMTGVIRVR